jgi:predicted house-cleaning noncanonical NTP pyrophosphatase (MazG superfamily)
MKKKYYHKKLIRDKIPEIIKAHGGEFELRKMSNKEFEKELKRKLIEETKELIGTSKHGMINELADVLEIIKSLSDHYKIDFKSIEKYQKDKRLKRGGFKKKLYLVWSDGPAGK